MSNKLTAAIRKAQHPIHRAMIACDVLPLTESDELIGLAMQAQRTGNPVCFQEIGRLIAPMLTKGDVAALRDLSRDMREYHRHRPAGDSRITFLIELSMRGTMVNGVGKPMAMVEIVKEFKARGFIIKDKDRKAFESWVRRMSRNVGLPIKGKAGNPTQTKGKL